MKEIINIEVKVRKADFSVCRTDLLAVGMFSDMKALKGRLAALDRKLGGGIKRLLKLGDFRGKVGEVVIIYGNRRTAARRVLLVGLGEEKKATSDTVRKAAVCAADKAVSLKAKRAVLALHEPLGAKFELEDIGQAIAEGVCYGGYRYDEFVTGGEDERLTAIKVEVVDDDVGRSRRLAKGVAVGNIVGQAQSFARTIANRPGNVVDPAALAEIAEKLAKGTAGLTCTVFDEKQLEKKKMGGILAVGSGSKSRPRLIVLKYAPTGGGAKMPVVGLVGKAITFDSGGLSIKPARGMEEMKHDKSGGLAVIGAMKAIAELKPAIKVYGIIPSAENMPGGKSYRPGDIITTCSGKTVEVQNTDAEGRMILCDGLHYAVEQKCETIIDIATLTGACKVALGKYKAGLMGNNEGLIEQLKLAGERSGEEVWHMPSGEEYLEEMKSKIADLKNTGSKWGGACTAAAFLGRFVGDKKWAHIDMAGVDVFEGEKRGGAVGATAFGVRLLTAYLMDESQEK